MYRVFRLILLIAAIPALTQLTGCALAAGAGLATGAVAGTDRRTTGTFIDDEIIEYKILDVIRLQAEVWDQSHINATSFNNIVLLTGETPSAAFKTRIAQAAASVTKVRSVHDELAIAAPSSMLARTSDTWVTSKVKTILLSEMKIDGTRIKVVTEKGVVYLMGLVSSAEADKATELARRVGGVERVVRLFEIT
jgi:osmotically-inducible protein OsmY